MKKIIIVTALLLMSVPGLWAQSNTVSAGGDATGSGGTFSFSVGQIFYTIHTGTTGSVMQGVQQPYEISITLTGVNLNLFIEGYYDAGTYAMRPVLANQGVGTSTTNVDNVTVELHDATTYALVASTTAMLQTNGNAVATFSTAPTGSFYIVIKHRNALETWSAAPQTVGATLLTYDFSNAANKAYGNNMKDLGAGVYGFYSGDINQDGFIEAFDFAPLFNDNDGFAEGYMTTDLNGDGFVEAFDYPVLFNNSDNFVEALYPY